MPTASLPRVPFIPENAPFSEEQRQWLNGFLAGLFSDAGAAALVPAPAPAAPPRTLRVLFGSQTGNAEGLAKKVATQAGQRGFAPTVTDLARHETADLTKEDALLIVTSTWGEGDPPDNAVGFWEKLQAADHPRLDHLRYSVLALGDRNYEDFCGCGRKIDERLAALGARRVHPRQDCDTDYDEPARAWMEGALAALLRPDEPRPVLPPTSAAPAAAPAAAAAAAPPAPAYSRARPFPARLLTARRLTAEGSDKDTRHYEICLRGSGLTYEVGDALGLVPQNDPGLVGEILAALGFDGEEEVAGADGASKPIRLALLRDYQIRAPHKEFLAAVAERDPADAFLRDLLDPGVRTELDQYLYGREIIDFLLPTRLGFSPGEFVRLLRKLQPRLYSIASSLKVHPEQVHLTVDTLRYEAHGRRRQGVSSTFLADRLTPETALPVFVQPAKHFRLPTDPRTPVIMVGPGTGIAPFRAFLEERQATAAPGGNWLYFGAQRAGSDFFYREQLEGWQAAGHLTHLSLAFSRDQEHKVYVQHRLLENAAETWRWLEEGAHFYVCGDARRMAKDVDDALHAVVRQAGGRGEDDAREYVQQMKKNHRYQRDVY